MQSTKIEYLTHTWNPFAMRCTPVSEGCANCWHLRMANRLSYNRVVSEEQAMAYGGEGPLLISKELLAPLHRIKPSILGVQFMGDLFHETITNEQIAAVFGVMAATPQHQYVILTKRLQSALEWFEWSNYGDEVAAEVDNIGFGESCFNWPLENVIMCASVEDQPTVDERVSLLFQIPARWRGVSVEPCLSGVDLTPWLNSDMVRRNHIGGTNEGQREGIFSSSCDGLVLGESEYRGNLEKRQIHRRQSNGNQAIHEDAGSASARGEVRFEKAPENLVHSEFAEQDGNLCASSCVDDSQPCRDTRWNGDQSQRRKSDQQPAKQFGNGDSSGKRHACRESAWRPGKEIPKRGAQLLCQTDRSASSYHQKTLCREAVNPGENSRDVRGEAENGQFDPCSQELEPRHRLDLVICGAETGPGKRPFKDEWALDLRDQCKSADVPFFFKRDGAGNPTLCGVEYHEWIGG